MNIDERVPSAIKLTCKREDFESYLFKSASERPDYVLNDSVFQVPVFITKLNKNSQSFIAKVREVFRLKADKMLMFSGFHILKKEPSIDDRVSQSIISDDGEIDTMRLGQLDEIKSLRPSKRKALCMAIEKIVKNKNDIDFLKDTNAFDIFSYSVFDNEKILNVFANSDYKETPPKCIVVDSGKSELNPCALVRILLMHLLAFDIIVSSYKSHSSIEDCLPKDYYDVYVYDDIPKDYNVTKEKKKVLPVFLWIVFAALVAYVVLHWGLKIL